MDKLFLFVCSLFCCIWAVTPLKCMTCHLRLPSDRCRNGLGVCVARQHEECMTVKIYKNISLQLSYMVCQKFCRGLTLVFNNRIHVHECCTEDYCNYKGLA